MNRLTLPHTLRQSVQHWLMACIALVVLMVALGGVTRLTESGLSIVEWKLVSGTLPPLSESAWDAEFDAYKTSPQFQQVNRDFALPDFKRIFWLEYLHRLLGRIIGLAVLGGTIYFGIRGIPRPLLRRLIGLSALVGAQGTVGWIMVASGLNHEPRVEPIKLALHLLLAFSLFSALLWTRWQVLGDARALLNPKLARLSRMMLLLLVVQITFGALVAGLRAGLSYNSYPLMDGAFIPSGLHLMTPWWKNHLESALTVQFQHRMGALAVVAGLLWLAAALRHANASRLGVWLAATVSVQFALGVATLLSGVNLWLASLHQLVALALVGFLVRILYLTPLDTNQPAAKNTP